MPGSESTKINTTKPSSKQPACLAGDRGRCHQCPVLSSVVDKCVNQDGHGAAWPVRGAAWETATTADCPVRCSLPARSLWRSQRDEHLRSQCPVGLCCPVGCALCQVGLFSSDTMSHAVRVTRGRCRWHRVHFTLTSQDFFLWGERVVLFALVVMVGRVRLSRITGSFGHF